MGFLLSSFFAARFLARRAFLCAGFSSHSASTAGPSLSWASAALGLFRVEVVSAGLNPSHGTIDVRRGYAPWFGASPSCDETKNRGAYTRVTQGCYKNS